MKVLIAGDATPPRDGASLYPAFLTHYFSEVPFRSIMDLSPASQVREVLRMRAAGQVPRRLMTPNYYAQRKRYEGTMREQFIRKGGNPKRQHPHYLILGESEIWSRRALNFVRLPLSAIPSEVISFTYTDSWYAYVDIELNGTSIPRQTQYGMVYRREELHDLFGQYGWPGQRWKQWRRSPQFKFDYYVEAQVWSDDPLQPFAIAK